MKRHEKGKTERTVVLIKIATMLQSLLIKKSSEHSHIILLETIFQGDGRLPGYAARFRLQRGPEKLKRTSFCFKARKGGFFLFCIEAKQQKSEAK